MTNQRFKLAALAGVLAAMPQVAFAQSSAPDAAAEAGTRLFYAAPTHILGIGGAVNVVGAQGSVIGHVVRGKPYSGESVTESTQVLADGNRITHVNRARVYRDGDGRTRTEQTLNGVGVWQTESEPVTIITINDPVEGVSHVLQPETHTARQLATRHASVSEGHIVLRRGAFAAAGPVAGISGVAVGGAGSGAEPAGAAQSGVRVHAAPLLAPLFGGPHEAGATETIEDLGEQILEAVVAHGTRRTQTIPAGAIGNERPIEIVTEEWYSPDIEAVILRHTNDPRSGETSYRLVNVVLGEPPEYLFEVPEDYAVHEIDPLPAEQ